MKIHYTLDDSAARLPLTMRSADALWDRAADLRSAPGVQLVELTTQHMLNIGTTLSDELADYFDSGTPSEADPYALKTCFANRSTLEDLLEDLRDTQPGLVALHQVAELFPITFDYDLQFMLALTVVGYPAFGYVRTYQDSEDEEYNGLVVNLAQARPHLESTLGHYSLELLINVIRNGFFNHEGFLLAYAEYSQAIGRLLERPLDRLKDALMSRGIAWHLSYRHDRAFYDGVLGLDDEQLAASVERCNAALAAARKKKVTEETVEDRHGVIPREQSLDIAGYHAARTIAGTYGDQGLRDAIAQGADHFFTLYNTAAGPLAIKAAAR
jgi:hypothetical protein